MICIFNDLIWWLPSGLFLVRGTAIGKRLTAFAPWLCVATHAVALFMMTFYLRPATLLEPDLAARASYIANHPLSWTIGWATWMAAAASLVGFYAWWSARLTVGQAFQPDRRMFVALAAVVITAIGMVCDCTAEGALILLLTERAPSSFVGSIGSWDPAPFVKVEQAFTLLSPGAANGLYTIGGILLTLLTPDLPKWVRTFLAGLPPRTYESLAFTCARPHAVLVRICGSMPKIRIRYGRL
jgi:hypothetical protein